MSASSKHRSWLLQIEAVNLDDFICDSDDLSTIRGAGLLLLNASRLLGGQQDRLSPADGLQNRADGLLREIDERNFEISIDDVTTKLRRISWGASVTIFSFAATDENAARIKRRIEQWLSAHQQLKHATIVVEMTALGDDFKTSLEKLKTKVRRTQMRQPNIRFGEVVQEHCETTNFCDIDCKRARTVNLKEQPPYQEGSSYARAADKNYASWATHERRQYGRLTKVGVYQMVADADRKYDKIAPAWEFSEIALRGAWQSAAEDRTLGRRFDKVDGKIAVIYIDGNKFGKLFDEVGDSVEDYADLDEKLRTLRRDLMRALLDHVRDKPHWTACVKRGGLDVEKTRIETLLWGGDELIWVVPAWCGLEVLEFFFQHTAGDNWAVQVAENDTRQLTHAVGMVFCSYRAPIRAVVTLAKQLAASVKASLPRLGKEAIGRRQLPAATTDFHHQAVGNAMAYEVLESFDHLGPDFDRGRNMRRLPQMDSSDAILTADGLRQLNRHLAILKHGTPRLPVRRIHQIIQTLRRSPKGECPQLDELVARIVETNTDSTVPEEASAASHVLNDTLHWQEQCKLPAKWYHLAQLWDYGGYKLVSRASK